MSEQLSRKCDGSHKHQHLVGGRVRDAAFYPVPLVETILKGISLQAAALGKLPKEEEEIRPILAMPMPAIGQTLIPASFGPPRDSSMLKFGGGSMPVRYEEANFKRHTMMNIPERYCLPTLSGPPSRMTLSTSARRCGNSEPPTR